MKKAIQILKILVEKKVIAAVLAILAVAIPQIAPWLNVNSPALVVSLSAILTATAVILAVFADIPFKKSDKGGKK